MPDKRKYEFIRSVATGILLCQRMKQAVGGFGYVVLRLLRISDRVKKFQRHEEDAYFILYTY
jgi:hypothetical protein